MKRNLRRATNTLAAALSIMIAAAMVPASAAEGKGEPPLGGVFRDNFSLMEEPVPAPETAVAGLDGRPVSLKDLEGEVVLLNFWATWCAPCVREMPSLERLQADLADRAFRVVAVSRDFNGPEVVPPFLERLDLKRMTVWLDPKNDLGSDFAVTGLPTTFLIDAHGRVVGGLQGPAEWDSPEAKALVEHYLPEPVRDGGEVQSSRLAER